MNYCHGLTDSQNTDFFFSSTSGKLYVGILFVEVTVKSVSCSKMYHERSITKACPMVCQQVVRMRSLMFYMKISATTTTTGDSVAVPCNCLMLTVVLKVCRR